MRIQPTYGEQCEHVVAILGLRFSKRGRLMMRSSGIVMSGFSRPNAVMMS